MAGPTWQCGAVPEIRSDIPHPARIYDYWLGGKDNFAADRYVAECAIQDAPELLDYARGNRQFLVRAVRLLARSGVRQFLDIGAGLPTSPNVHEVAQSADPGSRVVYVDDDPMVCLHAEALMAKNDATGVVRADLRDVDGVLGEAGKLLDFSQPTALMFVASLQHIEDEDNPAGIVARYLAALAPRSYLVLSHCTDEFAYDTMHEGSRRLKQDGGIFVPRSREAIRRIFNGRELLDPGLRLVSYWRPEGGVPDPNAGRVWAYGGIARI